MDEAGVAETRVLVGVPELTVSAALPVLVRKFESPEYVPVIVSLPTGALLAAHEPVLAFAVVLALSVAVHNWVVPTVKVTVPVGVPVDPLVASVTVAA